MEPITITTGVSVGDPKDLEERMRVVEGKIERDAHEIVETLKIDFPAFMERQAREQYAAAPQGFSLDAEALRAVKAALVTAGERAVAAICPRLEGREVWFTDAAKPPKVGERRDLRANPTVYAMVQEVGGFLREVLVEHGFPGVEGQSFDDLYRLPTWFIGGRLLISLVESYWRNLEEFRALQVALGAMLEQGARKQRGEAWDAA